MPSYPVADGPHNDGWKSLLTSCFAVIDEVVRQHRVDFPIQIGGGSMLLRRYRHRKSKDLDLFVTDARLVRWCSPRFNDAAADLFPDYGEEATALKLVVGMQDVDIIVAAPVVLDGAVDRETLAGRTILVERPREILAKKVAYRGRTFQPRDVFDLACVARAEPDEIAAVQPWLSPTHLDDLDARLDEIAPILGKELAEKVEAFPDYQLGGGQCLDLARDVVRTWREALTPKVAVPPHPPRSHRAVFSRDGLTVVIKEWDGGQGRHDKIGNTMGPAMVGPDGSAYFIGGTPMSEEDWRRHPDVVAHGNG